MTHIDKEQILAPLKWRRSVKVYDTNKKVSKEDIETILEAGRLAPSRANTQPWYFVVISDQETKEKLFEHSKGNLQVKKAPYLIVLCKIKDFSDKYIEQHLQNNADIRDVTLKSLSSYKEMLLKMKEKTDLWLKPNIFIPLGIMVYTAAQMHIDASPMGGFEHQSYSQILGLEEKGLDPVVLLAVGYRDESDPASKAKKVRRPIDRITTRI